MLNFSPATTSPLVFDSIPYAEDYTMVVVYRPVSDTETFVWRLTFADSLVRGLTTERIVSDSMSIRYGTSTERKAVIHTLRQSAPVDGGTVGLEVGDGSLQVAEVLYYDYRLGQFALRRVQTALAIRYGITLGPVDYVGSDGRRVWDHQSDSGLYHHRIAGVICDSGAGLLQKCSRSVVEGSVVTIMVDSIAEGAVLLAGDDDGPLAFCEEDGPSKLQRQWQVQACDISNMEFALTFDIRGLETAPDSLVLVMDSTMFLPSAMSADEVRFDNLLLLSDTSTFTLWRGHGLVRMAQALAGGSGRVADGGTAGSDIQYTVYPNPSTGRYTIEVTGAQEVQVTIYSQQGREMGSFHDSGRALYRFEGTLPAGKLPPRGAVRR